MAPRPPSQKRVMACRARITVTGRTSTALCVQVVPPDGGVASTTGTPCPWRICRAAWSSQCLGDLVSRVPCRAAGPRAASPRLRLARTHGPRAELQGRVRHRSTVRARPRPHPAAPHGPCGRDRELVRSDRAPDQLPDRARRTSRGPDHRPTGLGQRRGSHAHAREAQPETLRGELTALDPLTQVGRLDRIQLERTARKCLTDWQGRLAGLPVQARQMLRKLLEGRLVFTPTDDGTAVAFRGTGALDPASPMGVLSRAGAASRSSGAPNQPGAPDIPRPSHGCRPPARPP